MSFQRGPGKMTIQCPASVCHSYNLATVILSGSPMFHPFSSACRLVLVLERKAFSHTSKPHHPARTWSATSLRLSQSHDRTRFIPSESLNKIQHTQTQPISPPFPSNTAQRKPPPSDETHQTLRHLPHDLFRRTPHLLHPDHQRIHFLPLRLILIRVPGGTEQLEDLGDDL